MGSSQERLYFPAWSISERRRSASSCAESSLRVTGSIVVSRVGNGVAARSREGSASGDSGTADGRHETSISSRMPKAASVSGAAAKRMGHALSGLRGKASCPGPFARSPGSGVLARHLLQGALQALDDSASGFLRGGGALADLLCHGLLGCCRLLGCFFGGLLGSRLGFCGAALLDVHGMGTRVLLDVLELAAGIAHRVQLFASGAVHHGTAGLLLRSFLCGHLRSSMNARSPLRFRQTAR